MSRFAGLAVTVLAACVLVSPALTQSPSSSPAKPPVKASHPVKAKAGRPQATAEPAPEPITTPPPPPPAPEPAPPPTLEQQPPHAPEVTWDGKQLVIKAENSTLLAVLMAVRAQTGAVIEVPPSAASERVMAILGPAPVREVLTSLLYGTNFDYIIQASTTNEDAIQSVILTPRSQESDSDTTASVGTKTTTNPGIRRPPGYTLSGKHTFEVLPETPDGQASTESADGSSTPVSQESGSVSDVTGTGASTANADSSAPTGNSPRAENAAAGPDPSTTTAAGQGSEQNSDESPVTQAVKDMTKMFEQRRQIQSQQNQAQQKSSPQNQNQDPPSN